MKVGIQLYSVRQAMEKDPIGILKKVGDAGYKYIEVANHHMDKDSGIGFGVPAKEMRKILDDYGIGLVGTHLFPFVEDALERVLEYQAEVGCKRIGYANSVFPNGMEDVKARCEEMNRVGEKSRAYGIQFYYHNHFQEYQKFEGKTVMQHMRDNTEPDLVAFELDTYWAARGGVDPVEAMAELGDRLILLHQKDFTKGANVPIDLFSYKHTHDDSLGWEIFDDHAENGHLFIEIGTGVLPIQSYIDQGNKQGVEYIVLEQDYTQLDEIESIKLSMENFRKFSGIEWA